MNAGRDSRVPARTVLAWAIAAGAIVAQQVCSKAVRDSLFLSQLPASELPTAMLVAALCAVPSVLWATRAIRRHGPARVAPAVLLASAALFGLECALVGRAPVPTAWLLYLHVASLGGITLSAFFSSLSERFDPHSARLAIARVMSGAALGGLGGGLLVTRAAHSVGTSQLLLFLAVTQVACAIGLARMARSSESSPEDPDAGSVFRSLSRSSYLRAIALLIFATGFVSALLDWGFKASAARSLGSGPELLQMFALFHTATALLVALVQATLARRSLERLGLAGTLALLPASVLLSAGAAVVLPIFWSRTLMRGASSVLENSLFRTAYEPLYTPLSPAARRSTKTVIDVAGGRLGEALGSVVLLVVVVLRPELRSVLILFLTMAGAALCLFLSLRLQGGYIAELARSLRNGAVSLREGDLLDSTTRLMLSQTQLELSRTELVAQLEALRALPAEASDLGALGSSAAVGRALGRGVLPLTATDEGSSPRPSERAAHESAQERQLIDAVADLLSGERRRVLSVLERGPLDLRLVSFVLPLLEQGPLVAPVTAALKQIAPAAVGQLVDALLDPRQSVLVRRRIPRILRKVLQPRAAEGLWLALRAPERDVRYRAGSVLVELIAGLPAAAPSAAAVYELVREELRTGQSPQTLQHVFALLSLVLERDPLRFARRALASDDARQRGTALEYLHNTLPEPLRAELMAWLALTPAREASARSSSETAR
jgi:hypothetical protein